MVAAVQRGQRGNGSAFVSPRPLSPLHPSLPSIFLSAPLGEEGGKEVFSHGLFPNCFSLTFLRYFFVRIIFGHIFSLIGSSKGPARRRLLRPASESGKIELSGRNFASQAPCQPSVEVLPRICRSYPNHTGKGLAFLRLPFSDTPFPSPYFISHSFPSPPPSPPYLPARLRQIESGGRGKEGDIKLGLWLCAPLRPRL